MVTMENAEEYVELMFDFCMHTGIQKQMEAFRGACSSCITFVKQLYRNFIFTQMFFIIMWRLFVHPVNPSEGFNRVFPMEKLSSFSHKEVQMILCGNQSPSWTAEDVVNYTEPKLGYTRDRYELG